MSLSVYDRELLAIVQAVTKWSQYLLGQRFIIRTDQRALKFLMEQDIHTNAQLLWLTWLIPFDYSIEYKKGVEKKVADALSRVTRAELLALVISNTKSDHLQAIVDNWEADTKLKALIEQLKIDPTVCKQFTWQQNQLGRKGRLVVCKGQEFRKETIPQWYSSPQGGHSGVEATLKRLLTLFY